MNKHTVLFISCVFRIFCLFLIYYAIYRAKPAYESLRINTVLFITGPNRPRKGDQQTGEEEGNVIANDKQAPASDVSR